MRYLVIMKLWESFITGDGIVVVFDIKTTAMHPGADIAEIAARPIYALSLIDTKFGEQEKSDYFQCYILPRFNLSFESNYWGEKET